MPQTFSTSVIEPLEPRRLLAATAELTGGVLRVVGTDGDDRLSLSLTYGVFVDVHGTVKATAVEAFAGDLSLGRFVGRDVTRIAIDAGAGDDRIDAAGRTGSPNKIPTDLIGGTGDDTLLGGEANDRLVPGAGTDFFDGGGGFDTLDYAAADAAISTEDGLIREAGNDGPGDRGPARSGPGYERIVGTRFADRIVATELLPGDSTSPPFGGKDAGEPGRAARPLEILGGDGDDTLAGGGGRVDLFGEAGDDRLSVGPGLTHLAGGTGRDTLVVDDAAGAWVVDLAREGPGYPDGARIDLELGFDGDDVNITRGAVVIDGTPLDDEIRAAPGSEAVYVLRGGDGDDTLVGGDNDDALYGGAGDDALSGGRGSDSLFGDVNRLPRTDVGRTLDRATLRENLSGPERRELGRAIAFEFALRPSDGGTDVLLGGDGDDTLEGGTGADRLDGGGGIDLASFADATASVVADLSAGTASVGGTAEQEFAGFEGVFGGKGDDTLIGGDGDDVLFGASGSDRLEGRAGRDTLDGGLNGAGKPEVGLDVVLGGEGNDWFLDFNAVAMSNTFDRLDGGPGFDQAWLFQRGDREFYRDVTDRLESIELTDGRPYYSDLGDVQTDGRVNSDFGEGDFYGKNGGPFVFFG